MTNTVNTHTISPSNFALFLQNTPSPSNKSNPLQAKLTICSISLW